MRNGLLRQFLLEAIEEQEGVEHLTDSQSGEILAGLNFYINEYLAEQLPEQVELKLKGSE